MLLDSPLTEFYCLEENGSVNITGNLQLVRDFPDIQAGVAHNHGAGCCGFCPHFLLCVLSCAA